MGSAYVLVQLAFALLVLALIAERAWVLLWRAPTSAAASRWLTARLRQGEIDQALEFARKRPQTYAARLLLASTPLNASPAPQPSPPGLPLPQAGEGRGEGALGIPSPQASSPGLPLPQAGEGRGEGAQGIPSPQPSPARGRGGAGGGGGAEKGAEDGDESDPQLLRMDLRQAASARLAVLRGCATLASVLGLLGGIMAIRGGFSGNAGLLELQAGLAQQVALAEALERMAIGVGTSAVCFYALGVFRRAARDLIVQITQIAHLIADQASLPRLGGAP